jgi:hypothetical protein
MIPLADKIADELAAPKGRHLQERLLQAMFMMERYRGIDAGWRDALSEVVDADVSDQAIYHLAEALRGFVRNHKDHHDVGSAVWALSKLRAAEDAALYRYVLEEKSGYGAHAHEQAKCAMEDIFL